MNSDTEIEIRGKLTKKDFKRLKILMDRTGKLYDHYKRLSVDLSPGFTPKTRSWSKSSKFDLRVKKSADKEKISIKIGQFHQKERQEIELKLQKGEFLNAISLLETLGSNKGMIYFWESWEFDYKGFKVKLSKYTDSYYTWEIESDNPKLNTNDLAKFLDLHPYTQKEYNQATNWENKNLHRLYSYKLVEQLSKSF